MEKKGLRVNAGKTKVMICGTGLDLLESSGKYPCCTGVGNNSIYCKILVHNKFSRLLDWHQILIIGVHGAWEMPVMLTASHTVKSRSDLISWRW